MDKIIFLLNCFKYIFRATLILSVITSTILFSCSREVYNFSVNTVIADSNTKQTLSGAYFDINCIYQDNIDNSLSQHQKVQSDVGGVVSVSFNKGYLLEVKASCPGYLNYKDKVLAKKRFVDTLFLIKEPEKTDLSLSVLSGYNLSETTPYIRIKKVVVPDVKEKNHPLEVWGFDFLNNRATSNLDSADIWLDPKSTNNALIFKVNDNGGIYPVFENELSQSFFLEIENVPELNYYRSHKTSGTEKGFFVRCRDGKRVVKMIPEDYLCIVEYTERDKKVRESGVRLNYIIQKDTINSNKFPLVLIYELLNKAQTTSLNSVDKTGEELISEDLR